MLMRQGPSLEVGVCITPFGFVSLLLLLLLLLLLVKA
jgi:hypothetical protein